VFVIDDQAAVRHALGEMLRVFGYSVRTFESADAFLAALTGDETGCIVADVRMPGIDGIELVRELGRRAVALPVVLISGHADVPMAVAAIKAGAEDFIEKPVDDVQLLAAINRSLARTYARAQLRVECLDHVAGVGLVQVADQLAQRRRVFRLDRLRHALDVVGAHHPVLVAQGGRSGRGGRVLVGDGTELFAHAGPVQMPGRIIRLVRSRTAHWQSRTRSRAGARKRALGRCRVRCRARIS